MQDKTPYKVKKAENTPCTWVGSKAFIRMQHPVHREFFRCYVPELEDVTYLHRSQLDPDPELTGYTFEETA